MPITRESICDVRTCVLPDGIGADGDAAAFSRAVLVTWCCDLPGMHYQAYVNGRFAGATVSPEQRQLVVQLPSSFTSAVTLEIVGVEPEAAHLDFAAELDPPMTDATRVRLAFLRSQDLPLGVGLNVYSNRGGGAIDYSEPVNPSPIPVWSCPQDKAGFGLARFATGDFGYESAAAVGFGRGSFGRGQFGLDADVIEWISPQLPLGAYRFGVTVIDSDGHEGPATETTPVAVVPPAKPAATLNIVTYDTSENRLTLSLSDQT